LIAKHTFDKSRDGDQIVQPSTALPASKPKRWSAHAEAILRSSDLPYSVVMMCTGDMGFARRRN